MDVFGLLVQLATRMIDAAQHSRMVEIPARPVE
jgi:hypothetical protein